MFDFKTQTISVHSLRLLAEHLHLSSLVKDVVCVQLYEYITAYQCPGGDLRNSATARISPLSVAHSSVSQPHE